MLQAISLEFRIQNCLRNTVGWIAVIFLMACGNNHPISAIKLSSTKGNSIDLSSIKKNKVTVFYFLSPTCPLSENYTLQINELNERYRDSSIHFFAVIPGEDYTQKELDIYLDTYLLTIPVLLDSHKDLTKKLGATITPETFLLDNSEKVIYSGKIDNWIVKLGQKRSVVTEFYLQDAIDAILSQKPIPVKKIQAVGCFIE